MNTKQLIEKYKKKKRVPQILLSGKEVVIGQEADENNHLHYIVERADKSLYIKYAGKARIMRSLLSHKGEVRVHTKKMKKSVV